MKSSWKGAFIFALLLASRATPAGAVHVTIESRGRTGLDSMEMPAEKLRWVNALTRFANSPSLGKLSLVPAGEDPQGEPLVQLSLESAVAIIDHLSDAKWTPLKLAGLEPAAAQKDPVFRQAWEFGAHELEGERKDFNQSRIQETYRQLHWMSLAVPSEGFSALLAEQRRFFVDILTKDYSLSADEAAEILPPLGRVLGAFEAAGKAVGGQPGPVFNDDGSRNEQTLQGLAVLGQQLRGIDQAGIDIIGQMFRDRMIQTWQPLRALDKARTPVEFADAADQVAALVEPYGGDPGMGIPQALRANRKSGAVRAAAMIAAEKPFLASRGQAEAATVRFESYLAGHRRNAPGFISARRNEFLDNLRITLMFAEALAVSDRGRLRAALSSSVSKLFKSAQGILSFSRLPLGPVADIVLPLLQPIAARASQVRSALDAGMAYAEEYPEPDIYKIRSSFRSSAMRFLACLAMVLFGVNAAAFALNSAAPINADLTTRLVLLLLMNVVVLWSFVRGTVFKSHRPLADAYRNGNDFARIRRRLNS